MNKPLTTAELLKAHLCFDHVLHEHGEGLAYCSVCTGAEGSLPTLCPGRKMTEEEERAVYANELDFNTGPMTGAHWWRNAALTGRDTHAPCAYCKAPPAAPCYESCKPTSPNVKISSQGVAVDQNYFWDEDMSRCQRGVKYQLLGKGGMPEYKVYDGDPFWIAHALLPKRREPEKTCIRSVDANPPRSVPLRAAI